MDGDKVEPLMKLAGFQDVAMKKEKIDIGEWTPG
jgi:hypothetical protein